MKDRQYINWPFVGLILYLALLTVVGVGYANSQKAPDRMRLTGVTQLPAKSGDVAVSVRGFGLNRKLDGYLTMDSGNQRAIIGNMPVWGQALDVKISGDHLYVIQQDEGILAYDLRVPLDPVAISQQYIRSEPAWKLDMAGDRVYVSKMMKGFSVYDLKEGALLQNMETSGRSYTSVHRGDYLFVASGRQGVVVYDLSSVADAQRMTTISLPGETVDLALNGNTLLAASRSGGLHLIDISTIRRSHLIQTIPAVSNYDHVFVVNGAVYASDDESSMDIFRVENNRLRKQFTLPLSGRVSDALLDNDILYLAERAHGVSAFDISNPYTPEAVGDVLTSGEPTGLALYDEFLYVASSSQGVQIVDTRRMLHALRTPRIDMLGDAQALTLSNDWLYVASGDAGFQIVNRSNNDSMHLVSTVSAPFRIVRIKKQDNLVYLVAEKYGILTYDVQNPLAPTLVSNLKLDVSISDILLEGTNLYAGSYAGRLLRIDVSDPGHPWLAESVELPGRARRLAFSGRDVVVATGKAGLVIVRFEAGKSGRILSHLQRPWPMSAFNQAFGVVVKGDYVYLAQRAEGLQVIDISAPEAPRLIKQLALPGQSLDVTLGGDYAIVTSRWNGLNFIDIREPEKAKLATTIYVPRPGSGFAVEGELLYVPVRSGGVSVLPLPKRSLRADKEVDLTFRFDRPEFAGWYDLSVSDGFSTEKVAAVVEVFP